MSSLVYSKESNTGAGVFAKIDIKAQTPILEFGGDIVSKKNTLIDPSLYLQIGHDRVLGPSGNIDDLVNHSCNPNCYIYIVGNRAILYSLFYISKDSQLTFDYSLSSTDKLDEWSMECLCGSWRCRKIISGYEYISKSDLKRYDDLGAIPLFIKHSKMFME